MTTRLRRAIASLTLLVGIAAMQVSPRDERAVATDAAPSSRTVTDAFPTAEAAFALHGSVGAAQP